MRPVLALLALAVPLSAQAQTPAGGSYADSVAVRTERYQSAVAEAFTLYQEDRHAEAADRYAAAFTEYRVPGYVDLYNAASAAALAGEVGRAYGFLHRAIETGWEDDAHMDRDPDLAALRAYPDLWAETHVAVDDALRGRYGDTFDPALRADLLDMVRRDQAGRVRLDSLERARGGPLPDSVTAPLFEEMIRVDSLNLVRLEQVVAENGWPRISQVGRPAAQGAFLIVQHAPLEAQERYLPMLRAAVEAGEGIPSNLAYLTDRIRVRKGEPQVYGMQVERDPETGALGFGAIEDESGVDARRAAVGLGPIAEYARMIGFEYPGPDGSDN